jgi:hypothetical protein
MKLGKKPFKPDERDVKFSVLKATVTLPTPPLRFGHGMMFSDWKMLGNGPDNSVKSGFQGAGCCVFSGAGHETMETVKLGGHSVTITGKQTISDYSAVTGYVIGDDSTDMGTVVRDALKYRQKVGILDQAGNRHKIGAYVLIDAKSWDSLMVASYVFSAVGIGFEFPNSAMDQFDSGHVWDVVDTYTIEGGHYVPVFGRSSKSIGGCVTWGKRQGLTRDFYETFNDETWAMVYPEELRKGKTERGMDLTQLNTILSAL